MFLPAGAQAQGPAFDPATPTVLIGHDAPTQLLSAVQRNGRLEFDAIGAPYSPSYNAMAYDTDNNYLYATRLITCGSSEVLQIDANGGVTPTGVIVTIPVTGACIAAATYNPENGRLYFGIGGSTQFAWYNPATGEQGTQPTTGGATWADLTYADGYFWAVPDDGHLIRIDPDTGVATTFAVPASFGSWAGGAMWTYGNGNIGVLQNNTGLVTQIAITNPGSSNPTFSLVSQLPGTTPAGNLDAASIPGLPTEFAIAKTASQPPDGGTVTYTLTVTNNGPGNSSGYLVKDPLPAGLTNPSTSTPGCSISAGVLTCAGDPLNAGQTATITITATVPNPFTQAITNCSTVAGNEPDPVSSNNTGCTTVNPQADLKIEKSATPSPVVPGENVTWTITATNIGPNTSIGETVTDRLPSQVTFSSASEGCTQASGTVSCAVGTLAPSASKTFTITGRVASSLSECLANTATVSGAIDPNLTNNTASICTPILGRSGVSLTKQASTATVAAGGGQVMYTLVVRNNGPSDDPDVKVTDPLPAGLTLVSAQASQGSCTTANNTVSCDLGPLKDEGSAQVLVTANTTATPGCIINTARAQGTNDDPKTDDNQASAQVCVPALPPTPAPVFDLAVDKRASVSRPVIGQRVTYTIAVRNNGPAAAPQAKLTDTFNNRATVVSVRTTQGTCTRELPITCELGRIESGRSVTVTMVIVPLESGRQRNAASATSCCGTDSNPGNNMDTADITVSKVALKISKVASREAVRGGETFSYRIRVRNPTKGEARSVKVCDRLPSGLRYVSSKPKARVSGSQQCWTIARLAAGKSRTFTVTVRAASGASGRKTNTATLTSPDTKTLRARDTVRLSPLPDRPTG